MPCEWIYRRAQPSSAIQNRTASSVKHFLEMWKRRSPPVMRSTTMYLCIKTSSQSLHKCREWHDGQVWKNQPGKESAGTHGGTETYMYSISWKLYLRLHRKGWFRCSSIRRSRMMFRTLSERTTVALQQRLAHVVSRRDRMGFRTDLLPSGCT